MNIRYYWSKLLQKCRGKAVRGSVIDKTAAINSGSNIINSTLGRYSYCRYDCWIIETDIGNFCSISNNVRIGGPKHPIDWVSTSPVFHSGKNMLDVHFSNHDFNPYMRTTIGHDVWIGECAIIKAGITIGNGAVIGMGSVVTKDVPAYEIWAGNPARKIRDRFETNISTELLKSKWWEWSEDDLREKALLINDPKLFVRGNLE